MRRRRPRRLPHYRQSTPLPQVLEEHEDHHLERISQSHLPSLDSVNVSRSLPSPAFLVCNYSGLPIAPRIRVAARESASSTIVMICLSSTPNGCKVVAALA